jgi:CHAT domain-containing protein
VSFPRAFLSAGARSVIASLWPVDDASTARLMKHFYQELGGAEAAEPRARAVSNRADSSVGAAEALARAQRRYLREARTSDASAHPVYWAGFFLMGDGR